MLTTALFGAAACLVYTYLGYPLLLVLMRRRPDRRTGPAAGRPADDELPSVTVIVAAHNEAGTIAERIENLLSQDYPRQRLEVLVGSDGSTDDTVAIVNGIGDPAVRALDLPRQGRALVHNACAKVAKGTVLVFTDAGTLFASDCVRRLVAPMADPTVGCTSGELVYTNTGDSGITQGAGAYWRYELLLRRLESQSGSTVGTTGACMAMRSELFRPLSPGDDIDNAAPVDVLLAGRSVDFVAGALAYDRLPKSGGDELAARERMVTRNLTALVIRPGVLNPFRHPEACFKLISHRVMRYLTPVFLLVVFFANGLLSHRPGWALVWSLQILFYAGAVAGLVAGRLGRDVPVISTLYAFCIANVGFLRGVVNVLRRKPVTVYKPIR